MIEHKTIRIRKDFYDWQIKQAKPKESNSDTLERLCKFKRK